MTNSELIQNIDFDNLLFRISKGEGIADQEIISIGVFIEKNVQDKREKRSLEDVFAAITCLKKYGDRSLGHLLVKTLNVHDPLILSLAIETLVIEWDQFDEIEEQLISFALGVPFDHDGDAQESSIAAISHILNKDLPTSTENKNRFIKTLEDLEEDEKTDPYIRQVISKALSEFHELEKVRSKKSA